MAVPPGLSTVTYEKFVIENSMLGSQLKAYAEKKNLKSIRVIETKIGFYILVRLFYPSGKEYFLAPRLNIITPKLYTSLDRVNKFLVENALTDYFIVVRNQPTPPNAVAKRSSLLSPAGKRLAKKHGILLKKQNQSKGKKNDNTGKVRGK